MSAARFFRVAALRHLKHLAASGESNRHPFSKASWPKGMDHSVRITNTLLIQRSRSAASAFFLAFSSPSSSGQENLRPFHSTGFVTTAVACRRVIMADSTSVLRFLAATPTSVASCRLLCEAALSIQRSPAVRAAACNSRQMSSSAEWTSGAVAGTPKPVRIP